MVISYLPEELWVSIRSYLPEEFWVISYFKLPEEFWVSNHLPGEFLVAAWLSLVCSAGGTSAEPRVACSPLLAPLSSLLVR